MPRASPASARRPTASPQRYRHHSGGTAAAAPWLGSVPESSRARLRDHGRVIAASLIGSIEATGERERESALAAGMEAATDYGRIAGTLGATMRQTVATFLRFRRPFVEEMAVVARRRELDAAGTAALLGASAEAIDRLLDATLEGYEQAMTPRARRGQPAGPRRTRARPTREPPTWGRHAIGAGGPRGRSAG